MATNARRKLLAIPMMALPLLLTSCGDKLPVKATKPPPSLLTCAAEPSAPQLPAPGIERDRLVLGYVLALRAAYGDCAANLAGVRAWADALPD